MLTQYNGEWANEVNRHVQELQSGKKDEHIKNDLRATAYPLITIDPYTSAWSPADNLYDASPIHWTEKEFPLMGLVRIDWGYFYLAADKERYVTGTGNPDELRKGFVSDGSVASGQGDHLALSSRTVKVGKKPVRDFIMAGYDDKYSILYYGEKVRPYWNRKGDSSIEKQFALASDGYKDLIRSCREFDNQLMKDAYAAGGKEYAELCAVAYRQSVAAHKLIETPSGELAWLSKENFSNGSLGTVDVTYPSFPRFICIIRTLLHVHRDGCRAGLW